MEDIAPELLASLRKSFAERIEQSSIIDSLYKRIENGSATYAEAEDFAYEVGKCLAETFKSGLSSAVLPDGKMYYNIADRVIRPLLSDDHTIVSDAAAMVQKSLNKGAGIGLQVKKPKINEDRMAGIIDKVSDADQYDDVAWVLDAPVVNFSQSVVDDMIKNNVEFHGKAGLAPKIIRKAERKCCKWCKGLAGEYKYPDVPHDVYRRHENCRCAVLYDPADGSKKRQNVHSREWTTSENYAKIEARKFIGMSINKVQINGISDHIIQRMSERSVSAEAIMDAIQNPLDISDVKLDKNGRPSFRVIGEKATVCINPETGIAVTTYATHSKLARKLREGRIK